MKSFIRIVCLSFIIIGFLLLCYNKVNSYSLINTSNKKVEEFFTEHNNENKTISNLNYNYIGILEIPKIKLKKGFVNPFSTYNNINENVTILKPFMMPNEKNSTFILAAHSGNSNISYFKDLYKLSVGDIIYVYFDNKKYEYKVVKYYEEDKDGDITIFDNNSTKKLVLTTCKAIDKQLIYIAYLNKEILI